jgi:hypothetical protein
LSPDQLGFVTGRDRGGLAWPDLGLDAVAHVDLRTSASSFPRTAASRRVSRRLLTSTARPPFSRRDPAHAREPPTSWVRSTSSAAMTRAKSGRLAGISRGGEFGRPRVDSGGWPPIPVESGTLGDECLTQRGGRALRRPSSRAGIETRRPRDPGRRAARSEPARRRRSGPTTSAGFGLFDEQADVVVVASRERVQERPFGFPPFR